MSLPNIITIDGPAASGKTTLGLQLARELDYLFFDTGVMYRAITWVVLDQDIPAGDEESVTALVGQIQIDVRPPSQPDGRTSDVWVFGDLYPQGHDLTWEIRRSEVEAKVSQVSAYPRVRQAMTVQQRRVGLRGKVVMVGRDIGTVVLPEAEMKIYLDASVEERARRRFAELSSRGQAGNYEAILEAMRQRDQIDSTRRVAPLKPADDALILNSDQLDARQVVQTVKKWLKNE